MKKGIFIVYDDLQNNTGVNRKIKSQIAALQENGIDIRPKLVQFKTDMPGYKLIYRLPFSNVSPIWKMDKEYCGIDFVYLRRPFFCNVWFISLLKKLKKENPGLKIIYEIPTYPYDSEINSKKSNLPLYIKDKLNRKRLHKYVDRIANLTSEREVFSIKTLPISNGYDFSKQTIRKARLQDGVINIIAVALFDVWHGYERLLLGLKEYYTAGGTRKITIHFAGDGPALESYKKLANDLSLSDNCIFYGMQNQAQLDDLYDRCDIGATSFGLYRKKITVSKELKSREYLAKGLPIICSGDLDLLDVEELKPYLLQFSNDETPVDFGRVVAFRDRLYQGKTETNIKAMCDGIRATAEKHYNMTEAMRSVIDYIQQ